MKCLAKCPFLVGTNVAPRVGAWIEIHRYRFYYRRQVVAPRVGAWIEIICTWFNNTQCLVAPRVGAWIEISYALSRSSPTRKSPPAWGRGLK